MRIRVFGRLTALDNVLVGAIGNHDSLAIGPVAAMDLLENARLSAKADHPASALSHGEARLLGIARAIAMNPMFLLLDEPAAGLNTAESRDLAEYLTNLALTGRFGLLVVEHDMRVIMSTCERIHVIDSGVTVAIGSPREIRNSSAVREDYLGSAGEDE